MKHFKNLKLVTKISILSLQFILFLLVIGFIGLATLYNQNNDFKSLNDDRLIPLYDLGEAKMQLMEIRMGVLSHLSTSDKTERAEIEGKINENEIEIIRLLDKYRITYLVDSEIEGLVELDKAYAEYIASKNLTLKFNNEGNYDQALQNAKGDAGTKYLKAIQDINTLLDIQVQVAQELYETSEKNYSKTMILFAVVLLVCILLGIIITFTVSRAVSLPMIKVTSKLHEISENGGDLRQRIGMTSKDEVGQLGKAFDLFMDKLQLIIKDVSESAHLIAASSQQLSTATSETNKAIEQIASGVNEVANSTNENMAVVEQTTASLNEAARFSETTAESSKKTSVNSIIVKTAAEEGANQVTGIVESMKNISHSSKEVAVTINELGESSKKISEIVQLITNVSAQTNLLALNAAIEAARAGEAGKGFSVVAEEIRKLADESNKSAKQIVELVKDNQLKVDKSVKSVGEVDDMVSLGVQKATEVKTNMDNIIDNIKDIVEQITDIDKAVEKQAEVTEEITKGMNNIAGNAADMAAATEEMSASVEEQVSTFEEIEATANQLAEMAQKLNNITSGFTV
ncbi:MAG: methyl-accepting chemotaxis protein [Vallitaleaceae bacterium]|nr:methyl-accepting chemotaxis protein [Vallitaleaceae bacterium]